MKIEKYVQGQDNKKIFCNIGSWLTNKKVQDELGMAVTSQDDDNWYIASLNDVTIGFALTRYIKSTNSLHVRFLYADPETKKALVKKILTSAKEDKLKSVFTNDRGSEPIWKNYGFEFTSRSRGEFGRWEKDIICKEGEKK